MEAIRMLLSHQRALILSSPHLFINFLLETHSNILWGDIHK